MNPLSLSLASSFVSHLWSEYQIGGFFHFHFPSRLRSRLFFILRNELSDWMIFSISDHEKQNVWQLFIIRQQEIIQQPSSWSQLYSRSNPTFRMQLLMIWISKPVHHFTSKSISLRVFMSYKISVFILSSRICELFSPSYSNLPSRICIKAKGILARRPNCLLIQTL